MLQPRLLPRQALHPISMRCFSSTSLSISASSSFHSTRSFTTLLSSNSIQKQKPPRDAVELPFSSRPIHSTTRTSKRSITPSTFSTFRSTSVSPSSPSLHFTPIAFSHFIRHIHTALTTTTATSTSNMTSNTVGTGSHLHSVQSTSPPSASSPSSSSPSFPLSSAPNPTVPSSPANSPLTPHPFASAPHVVPAAHPAAPKVNLSSIIRLYGPVGLCTYLSIYFSTLAAIYVGISSHLIPISAVYSVFDTLGATEWLQSLGPKAGDFAIAWLTTKLTEPIRLAATVAITPKIGRWVGVKVEEKKLEKEAKAEAEAEAKTEAEEKNKAREAEGRKS